jgi:hypothetical protein
MTNISKRKQSSSSNTEKLAKASTSSTPKSQLARGDSLTEEYSNAAVELLAKKLEKSSSISTEESPRKPSNQLPTPAPSASHSRLPSLSEYAAQAEFESQRLGSLMTQFGDDVLVGQNNDNNMVKMTLYRGQDATIPAGKVVSNFIRGDGNCGFRSIAHCLFQNQNQHNLIRRAACLAIRQYSGSFMAKPGGLEAMNMGDQSVDDYLASKSQVAVNAGQRERWIDGNLLEAAALAYKFQLMIYTQQGQERLLLVLDPVNAIPGNSISIVQIGGHYEVLIDTPVEEVCFLSVIQPKKQKLTI